MNNKITKTELFEGMAANFLAGFPSVFDSSVGTESSLRLVEEIKNSKSLIMYKEYSRVYTCRALISNNEEKAMLKRIENNFCSQEKMNAIANSNNSFNIAVELMKDYDMNFPFGYVYSYETEEKASKLNKYFVPEFGKYVNCLNFIKKIDRLKDNLFVFPLFKTAIKEDVIISKYIKIIPFVYEYLNDEYYSYIPLDIWIDLYYEQDFYKEIEVFIKEFSEIIEKYRNDLEELR